MGLSFFKSFKGWDGKERRKSDKVPTKLRRSTDSLDMLKDVNSTIRETAENLQRKKQFNH